MKYQAILFDLDGTLVDSALDLINTLNTLLQKYQRPMVKFEQFRSYISHGASYLIEAGFAGSYPVTFDRLKQEFLDLYCQNSTEFTDFFDGVPELLDHIEKANIPWGIVTNKWEKFTLPIIQHLAIEKRASVVICGDTLSVAKPDPGPLFLACNNLKIRPENCVYIGDAPTDVDAGKRANMATIACAFGYINEQFPIIQWGANAVAQSPKEILKLLS